MVHLVALWCLDKEDTNYVLREVHEGVCENDSRVRSLAYKALRQGYLWPTMYQDAQEKTRSYRSYQNFASFPAQQPEILTTMTSPRPFAQWGINLIESLPKGWRAVTHAIVAVDYFTKWVKVKALSRFTENDITDFIWRNLVCRYRIPYALIADNN